MAIRFNGKSISFGSGIKKIRIDGHTVWKKETSSEFYVEAVEDGTVTLNATLLTNPYYKLNTGDWQAYTINTGIDLTAGDKCYFKAEAIKTAYGSHLTTTMKYNVGGDVKSLYNSSFDLTGNSLAYLFYANSSGMYNNLQCLNTDFKLSATILAESCYEGMFKYCKSLANVCNLPAATLVKNCYYGMFEECNAVVTVPTNFIAATTGGESSCYRLFYNCKGLKYLPEGIFSMTSVGADCFNNAFSGCANLKSLPDTLFATITTVGDRAFSSAFYNCLSLTVLPKLSATSLSNYCYVDMFKNCVSIKLSEIPDSHYTTEYRIPATEIGTAGTGSLRDMFTDTSGSFVGSLDINKTYYYDSTLSATPLYVEALSDGEAKFNAITLTNAKYKIDDADWQDYTKGTSIALTTGQKCYFKADVTETDTSQHITMDGNYAIGGDTRSLCNNILYMPNRLEGLFYQQSHLQSMNNDFKLSAMAMATYAYREMFKDCTNLTNIADYLISAKKFNAQYVCSNMFDGCTSLVTLPEHLLSAVSMRGDCNHMFKGCSNLTTVPANLLDTVQTLYGLDFLAMFQGCASLTTLPNLPVTTLKACCYQRMFEGCTSIKLSDTQTGIYQIPYRIPTTGEGTDATDAMADMFTGTGGTFTGTPTINTTYYTSNEVK